MMKKLNFRRLNLVKYLEKTPLLHVCDSLHNNFIIWSSTSIYAVLLNFETETLKHTNLWVLLSQHLKRLSVLHGCLYLSGRVCQTPLERKANDYDRNMSVVCVWPISVTDTPTYKPILIFYTFFVHRNLDYINTLDNSTSRTNFSSCIKFNQPLFNQNLPRHFKTWFL